MSRFFADRLFDWYIISDTALWT